MSLSTLRGQLAADVADTGTFTVSYPNGKDKGSFYLAMGHQLVLGGGDVLEFPRDFNITLNAANITVTNNSGRTWVAGLSYVLQLEEIGRRAYRAENSRDLLASTTLAPVLMVTLGAPVAAAAASVCAAQARAAAGDMNINGTRAVNSVATLDVPRSLQMVSANAGDTTQSVTVYGTDVYGRAVAERRTLNGTTAGSYILGVNIRGESVSAIDPTVEPNPSYVFARADNAVASSTTITQTIQGVSYEQTISYNAGGEVLSITNWARVGA